MKKSYLINFPISTGTYPKFLDYITRLSFEKSSKIICVANVHMYIEAYKDQNFLQIINNSDLVTPDGRPLIWGLKLLEGIKTERVAGMDLLPDLLQKMSEENISVFFYGGTQEMLDKTKIFLDDNYSNLKISGLYSPPFESEDGINEKEIIKQINSSSPCIVFVVLGCPKQEKWMASMKDKINTVMIGIGGALPVMLGIKKRAPVWMQRNGMEWLFRLSQEPKRLFRRYITTNSLFLWVMVREYIKVKILKSQKV